MKRKDLFSVYIHSIDGKPAHLSRRFLNGKEMCCRIIPSNSLVQSCISLKQIDDEIELCRDYNFRNNIPYDNRSNRIGSPGGPGYFVIRLPKEMVKERYVKKRETPEGLKERRLKTFIQMLSVEARRAVSK